MSVYTTARSSPRIKVIAGLVALALGTGLAALGLTPRGSEASSHREAPLVAADPQVDNTDVYAFRSPDAPDTVTLISNWIPFEEPAGGPNFYPFATGTHYDIKVDNDGDARADSIYRWKFRNHRRNPNSFIYNNGPVTSLDDENLLLYQTYDLERIKITNRGPRAKLLVDDAIAAPSYVGAASMPDYAGLRDAAVNSFGNGSSKAFAGQADDPFFLDLRVFDLLYGGDLSEAGDDTLAGFNVNTLAIQVPRAQLAAEGDVDANPVIGVWSNASRKSTSVRRKDGSQRFTGHFVDVSRLGMPLVNEVVIPIKDKDRWNSSRPINDGQFLDYVVEPELPELVEAVYPTFTAPDTCGSPDDPPRCRTDLVAVFLTGIDGLNQPAGVTPSEQLRLNMTTPPCEEGSCGTYSRLGVIGGDTAGYPNGRRLADDTIDISLQVVEGELIGSPNDLGDGVDENDVMFGSSFPYLALPFAGSDASPHP